MEKLFSAGDEADLEKAWLKVEVHLGEEMQAQIVPSPFALVGTAIEAQHRVIQVCVGAEHGVLLTDAGIAFTWGDNRFGQLGRPPVHKEENGSPFPVLDLLDEEVAQVAAGKNHCLALTADGGVKAWGRNKHGQLGIGTFRDKVEPKWVRLPPKKDTDDLDSGPKLGGIAGDRNSIVTIGAGGNSSIAAAVNSDVWQWGELNSDYKADAPGDKKHKSSSKDGTGGGPVPKARPFQVASWARKSFRTQMRKEKDKVSVSETLCLVLDKEDANSRMRIKDLVEEDKRWRDEIARGRLEERKMEEAKRGVKTSSKDSEQEGDLGDLQDTIAFLERDIEVAIRDIDLMEKNITSCEQQQSHNRKQIEALTHQATQLTESQGKYSQQMLEGKKSGQQKKQLEVQLSEIKDFIEANQNTRATLLDQRAETDKEKQRMSSDLQNKKTYLHDLNKRLKTLQDLGHDTRNSSGASDTAINFLGKEKEKLTTQFDGKSLGNADILEAKKKLEKDEAYLRNVEMRLQERGRSIADSGNAGTRQDTCAELLEDLVALRRKLNDLTADKYFKDDLSFECFFKLAEKPQGFV